MKRRTLLVMLTLMITILFVGGCAGKGERKYGLEPEAVVKAAFEDAKAGKISQAAAYIAPSTLKDIDTSTVSNMLTGFSIKDLKSANLLSVKKISNNKDFAVVVATLHQADTLKISVKTLGLERIDDDWYIVPTDRIVQDTKYRLLAELLGGI